MPCSPPPSFSYLGILSFFLSPSMPVGSFFFNYPPTFLLTPHPPTHPWVAWRYILVLPGVLHTTTPQAIYFTCRNYNSYEPSSFFSSFSIFPLGSAHLLSSFFLLSTYLSTWSFFSPPGQLGRRSNKKKKRNDDIGGGEASEDAQKCYDVFF